MRVPTQVALFFATAVAFTSAGAAVGHGPADAIPLPRHHASATLTNATCIDGQPAWQATLSVSADVPNGTATIEGATNGTRPVPFTATYSAAASDPSMSFTVTVRWPSGFVAELEPLSVDRPDGGCGAPPSTTTSTTICEQANPPRDDCGEAPTTIAAPTTSLLPTTSVVSSSTTAAPTVDSTPQITQASTPNTVVRRVPVTPAAALPATGAGSDVLLIFGIALVVTGGLLVATRRRGVS